MLVRSYDQRASDGTSMKDLQSFRNRLMMDMMYEMMSDFVMDTLSLAIEKSHENKPQTIVNIDTNQKMLFQHSANFSYEQAGAAASLQTAIVIQLLKQLYWPVKARKNREKKTMKLETDKTLTKM